MSKAFHIEVEGLTVERPTQTGQIPHITKQRMRHDHARTTLQHMRSDVGGKRGGIEGEKWVSKCE